VIALYIEGSTTVAILHVAREVALKKPCRHQSVDRAERVQPFPHGTLAGTDQIYEAPFERPVS